MLHFELEISCIRIIFYNISTHAFFLFTFKIFNRPVSYRTFLELACSSSILSPTNLCERARSKACVVKLVRMCCSFIHRNLFVYAASILSLLFSCTCSLDGHTTFTVAFSRFARFFFLLFSRLLACLCHSPGYIKKIPITCSVTIGTIKFHQLTRFRGLSNKFC